MSRSNAAIFLTIPLLASCAQGVSPTHCTVAPKALDPVSGVFLQPRAASHKLSSHIPQAVLAYSDLGKMDETQALPITLALPLNHEEELDQRLLEMYQPGAAGFHRFVSTQEFMNRYAPTEAQVAAVQSYLQSQGIPTSSVSANRMLVHASGNVGALNAVFNTEVHRFKDPTGAEVFSPAYEIQVPEALGVRAVHGLQNVTKLRPAAKPLAQNAAIPHAGTGPNGGFSPADINKAYRLPAGVNGAGETLAVFELDGYRPADITAYETHFGLPNVPLSNVLVGSATGSVGAGEGEVTLDIELMIAVAPGAKQILVYEGINGDQGILDTYAKIASDNLAREVSTSWGSAEDTVTSSFAQSDNLIFKQMAAQGQSIFAAAGDNGALDNGSSLSVDDPGAQPFVVGVGGTRLATNSDGSYKSETTWNADG
ncbi:MAG: S53 family peptidase, partial [Bdellovibrionota bacterium]